jgi:AraC family transcriptional regulator
MTDVRIIERPSFDIIGKKAWIDGPDNDQFGRFWESSRADGLLDVLQTIREQSGQAAGAQTSGSILGVSRVEENPEKRDFYYMIAIEAPPAGLQRPGVDDLERYTVPPAKWAVFSCRGKVPESIVAAEMYAFGVWLPQSGFQHALAPEMEVYSPISESECEFWLPIV